MSNAAGLIGKWKCSEIDGSLNSRLYGISKWEKDSEALLKHYQATVMEIIAATRSSATGKLQVIRRGSGLLKVQERVAGDNTDVLPHDLRSKW
jgi:hypothetical protein